MPHDLGLEGTEDLLDIGGPTHTTQSYYVCLVLDALIYEDDPAAVLAFRAAEGGDWPMLVDPDETIAAKFTGGVRVDELEALLTRVRTPPPPEDPNP